MTRGCEGVDEPGRPHHECFLFMADKTLTHGKNAIGVQTPVTIVSYSVYI